MSLLRTPDRLRAAARLAPALFAFAALPVLAQEEDAGERPLEAELVAQHAALRPGADALLGLRLRHAPHWHSYWINPGDSGLPTRLAWQVPQGWRAGDIEWPLPRRYAVGTLQNFGYEGEIVLPVALGESWFASGSLVRPCAGELVTAERYFFAHRPESAGNPDVTALRDWITSLVATR